MRLKSILALCLALAGVVSLPMASYANCKFVECGWHDPDCTCLYANYTACIVNGHLTIYVDGCCYCA
jgi:hypothetical protein